MPSPLDTPELSTVAGCRRWAPAPGPSRLLRTPLRPRRWQEPRALLPGRQPAAAAQPATDARFSLRLATNGQGHGDAHAFVGIDEVVVVVVAEVDLHRRGARSRRLALHRAATTARSACARGRDLRVLGREARRRAIRDRQHRADMTIGAVGHQNPRSGRSSQRRPDPPHGPHRSKAMSFWYGQRATNSSHSRGRTRR